MILPRSLQPKIEDRLKHMPAAVLLGPRQVGKTTLAKNIAAQRGENAVYLDLERPMDRRRLDDADAYLRTQRGKLVVIDEIHRTPALFEILRGIIDDRRESGDRAGHFLLLGSASLDLMKQTSETLVGRVAYLELPPLMDGELPEKLGGQERLWIRGGFPDSALAQDDAESVSWRQDFIRSYLERDVPMFAPRLPAETVGRLWTMLAHAQGTQLNQTRLATALAVSVPAVARYVDLLVELLLVRRLRPWSGNVGKRLVRSPRIYVRDCGLVHALLDLTTTHDLLGHPVCGASWKGFAIENIIAAAGAQRTPYFYRTERGAEMDLLLERGGRVEMAIEIKRTTAPKLSRGFHSAREVLNPAECYLMHAGSETWTIRDGVTAIPLSGLLQRLCEN